MKTQKEIKEKISSYKSSIKEYKRQKDWISCARIQERLLVLERLSEIFALVVNPENQIKKILKDNKKLIKNEVSCFNYYKADKFEQTSHMLEWVIENEK